MAFWNSIPKFGFTPVVVIDRGEHQVLKVPAKRGVFHPNVNPRNIDSAHIFESRNLKKRVWLLLEIRKVPWVVDISLITLLVPHSKSISKSFGIEVRCILYFDFLADLILDHVPVFSFNSIIYLLIIRPVNVSIDFLSVLSDLSKLLKGVPLEILIEWNSLRELL